MEEDNRMVMGKRWNDNRQFDYNKIKKLRRDGYTLQEIADIVKTKRTGTIHYIINAQ